jgi:hypothetical protein
MDCSGDNQEAFALSNESIEGKQSDETQPYRTTHLNQMEPQSLPCASISRAAKLELFRSSQSQASAQNQSPSCSGFPAQRSPISELVSAEDD